MRQAVTLLALAVYGGSNPSLPTSFGTVDVQEPLEWASSLLHQMSQRNKMSIAGLVELADTLDSKPSEGNLNESSSLSFGTKLLCNTFRQAP